MLVGSSRHVSTMADETCWKHEYNRCGEILYNKSEFLRSATAKDASPHIEIRRE